MYKILTLALAFTLYGYAETNAQGMQIDDGIRNAQSMVVSGDSVIDDETVDDDIEADFADSDPIPDEESTIMSETGAEGISVPTAILPENPVEPMSPLSPSAPKQVRKRVVKPYEQMKIRRSIRDERIDDYYVQEMVKDNYLFTPDLKR